MSDDSLATYRVVFWGEVAPQLSRREVALKFSRRFRIRSAKQLKYLFSGRLLPLKRGLTEAEARRFRQVVTDLGAVCRLEREVDRAWSHREPPEQPRHTASIRFDLQGLSALDFSDSAPAAAIDAEPVRDPFGARDLPEAPHPPVKYYDGRPVR